MAHDTDLDAASACALADMARVRPVLDKIADKWTILILTVLCPRPARFNAIKRRLDGITHKALADTLKRLERNGLASDTSLSDLATNEKLRAEIAEAVDAANAKVSKAEAIKKFNILDTDFTIDSGELTPTMKLKRNVIHSAHQKAIADLYT